MAAKKEKRELSDAQKAHLARLHAANEERRGVHAGTGPPQPTAVAEPPAVGPPAGETESDDLLAKLGAALMDASQSRQQRNAKLQQFDALLSTLDAKDYPELAANPVIQQFIEAMSEQQGAGRGDDPPGTIYNKGKLNEVKKTWQWRDLSKFGFRDPVCRDKGADCPNCGGSGTCIEMVGPVTPNETKVLTWNGLAYPVVADTEQWLPRPHYYVYMQSRVARRAADEHAKVMFRQADIVTSDPSIVGPGTAKVRGSGIGTQAYRAGAGLFNPGEPEGEGSGES